MKHLLAVVGDYFPYPSSNTNCFDPLLRGLEKNGWSVDIVTARCWPELPHHEIEESGREVWRIDDIRNMNTVLQNRIRGIDAPKPLKIANTCFSMISKALFALKYGALLKPTRVRHFASWPKQEIVNTCIELHKLRKYDLVISFSHPVICHETVIEFRKKLGENAPHWILYEFDPYCYNQHLYGKNCYQKLAAKQHELFRQADTICLIPELYDFYQKTPYQAYKDKMVSVNYPNMNPVVWDTEKAVDLEFRQGRIQCVFAGAFSPVVRDPEYALTVFSRCQKDISWNILTGYNLEKTLQGLNDVHSVLKVYPQQSRDTAYGAMEQADILVNVGNSVSFQTPGKIFEYMALGKPIIHFQKIEEDPCLKYLKEYPMILVIDERQNDPQKHAEKIEEFCRTYAGKTLSFQEVSEYIPQYIGKRVIEDFAALADTIIYEESYAKK